MSRVGNPYDNAKAESFMKTLKQEEVDGTAYRDADHARTGSAASLNRPITANGSTPRSTTDRLRIRRSGQIGSSGATLSSS
jgi:transposase InsO family protein